MEADKRKYLQQFLDHYANIKECVNLIKTNETRLRDSYAEPIQLSSEDFIKMVLVDAAFLIMLFMQNYTRDFDITDKILYKPWIVLVDLALLENQLPFFILEELFNLSKIHESHQGLSMIKLTHEFVQDRWPFWVTQPHLEKYNFSKVDHIVDFLRIYHVPKEPKKSGVYNLKAPSVTELHQAGVKFRLHCSSENFLDIQFKRGVLQIPSLEIRDSTEVLFRNVLAFEQLHCRQNYINDYVCFMSNLVSTPKDVQLLAEEGILIDSRDNTEALLILFHDLKRQSTFFNQNFYFFSLTAQLGDYYRNPWHKWKATLKQDYFSSPWATISIFAAFILLFLTFIQSVCSVLDLFKF